MKIYITVEADVTEKVFEELKELHEKPELVVGTEEQYKQAIETVEAIVNLPFYDKDKYKNPSIVTVWDAEDGIIILE